MQDHNRKSLNNASARNWGVYYIGPRSFRVMQKSWTSGKHGRLFLHYWELIMRNLCHFLLRPANYCYLLFAWPKSLWSNNSPLILMTPSKSSHQCAGRRIVLFVPHKAIGNSYCASIFFVVVSDVSFSSHFCIALWS